MKIIGNTFLQSWSWIPHWILDCKFLFLGSILVISCVQITPFSMHSFLQLSAVFNRFRIERLHKETFFRSQNQDFFPWVVFAMACRKIIQHLFFIWFCPISGRDTCSKACWSSWDILHGFLYQMPQKLWWWTNKSELKERRHWGL